MMSMRFFTLLALAATFPLSQATEDQMLDVWSPTLTYPHEGTVWKIGEIHHVKWDTSDPPSEITQPLGKLYLWSVASSDIIDYDDPLASGFPLSAGVTQVTVPPVSPGPYQLILAGDSGNMGPQFTIDADE